jgi:tetratricopeptide (TPR) repeat protein
VLYHALASAELLIPVEAHLSLLVSLLRGSQPEPLRHRIASAAVEAAGFAAWLWFDLGDQFKMGARYELADELLGEAGNPSLGAYVTGYRALAAEASGLDHEAAGHAEAARIRAPATTSQVTRSWLSAVSANAVALTGDRRSALDLLGQACEHLDASGGREEWMYDFDHGALAAYQGQCHLRLGQPDAAITAFEAGLAGLPEECDRRRASLAIGLAEACLLTGALDAAIDHAYRALAVYVACGSVAGLSRVQQLRGVLAGAGHQREAEDLDQQVRGYLANQT